MSFLSEQRKNSNNHNENEFASRTLRTGSIFLKNDDLSPKQQYGSIFSYFSCFIP